MFCTHLTHRAKRRFIIDVANVMFRSRRYSTREDVLVNKPASSVVMYFKMKTV